MLRNRLASPEPAPFLVLGYTNTCLSVIGAKLLHIHIFHLEVGNRCKDNKYLPEETNRCIVDYVDKNISTKVIKIIHSYTGVVNKLLWHKF